LEIKNLLKFCNLSWNNNCLKFYNNKRVIKTASDTQVRKKIYKSSVGSWKNYEKYLEECLNSIINQTYDNWEVIFWDNQSRDNSKKIFEKFNDDNFIKNNNKGYYI